MLIRMAKSTIMKLWPLVCVGLCQKNCLLADPLRSVPYVVQLAFATCASQEQLGCIWFIGRMPRQPRQTTLPWRSFACLLFFRPPRPPPRPPPPPRPLSVTGAALLQPPTELTQPTEAVSNSPSSSLAGHRIPNNNKYDGLPNAALNV